MIKRPKDLKYIKASVVFNLQEFIQLEIDLSHINKNERSAFKVDEVVEIFKALVGGKILAPSDEKKFGDEFCAYYVTQDEYINKKYKVIFCICSDRPESIGLITLFRVR